MSNLSPSIDTYEFDYSMYPGMIRPTQNIGMFIGEFEKGEIGVPKFIGSALQFKQTFGRAMEWNYNDWYQVYNYLTYSSGIWVTRVAGEKSTTAKSGNITALSPGEWGNILEVWIIKSSDYETAESKRGFFKNFLKYREDFKEFLILVFRKDSIVENFDANTLSEINSNYVNLELVPGYFELSGGFTDMAIYDHFEEIYNLFTKENYEIDIILSNDKCNELGIAHAEKRKDCVCYLGVPPELFEFLQVNEGVLATESGIILLLGHSDIAKHMDNKTKIKIIDYINTLQKSEYAFFVLGFKVIIDEFTGKKRYINVIGDIAGMKSMASLGNPWDMGIGILKGTIRNFESTKYYINKSDVVDFYRMGVNCLKVDMLMSQKLFLDKKVVTGDLHSRNILNYLERACEKLIKRYLFNINNISVRGKIATDIKMLLDNIKSMNGIEAGKVIVKSESEDNIIINIYIKISHIAEFINLRFTNTGTNNFTEIFTTI